MLLVLVKFFIFSFNFAYLRLACDYFFRLICLEFSVFTCVLQSVAIWYLRLLVDFDYISSRVRSLKYFSIVLCASSLFLRFKDDLI